MKPPNTLMLLTLQIIIFGSAGCSTSFYKEAGVNTVIAAAYDQSDEKQRGMTQYEYEQEIKNKQAQQNDEEEQFNAMRNN